MRNRAQDREARSAGRGARGMERKEEKKKEEERTTNPTTRSPPSPSLPPMTTGNCSLGMQRSFLEGLRGEVKEGRSSIVDVR